MLVVRSYGGANGRCRFRQPMGLSIQILSNLFFFPIKALCVYLEGLIWGL